MAFLLDRRLARIGRFASLTTVVMLLSSAAPARAQAQDDASPVHAEGRVAVTVKQNGALASGSFEVHRLADPSSGAAGELVASGRSGLAARVAAGHYDVVVRLDGAIDRPERWIRGVTVAPGRTADVEASFSTAILEVRVTSRGRRAAATVLVRRAGEADEIATLGAGVRAVISAGVYDIVVRHRALERVFAGVELTAGRARALSADFSS